MKIDNNLLVKTVHAPERQVTIPCQEIRIDTIDQEIAVRWKNSWHWKRTNEVGDGMEVLRVHERKEIDVKIDPERFLYGLSPWQEYDEQTNKTQTYFYKFSKNQEDVDATTQLIKEITPSLSLQVEGRFVVLHGVDGWLINPNDILQKSKEIDESRLFSFFYGLVLAYGDIKIEESVLHNCTIRLSLTGPIGIWSELLQTYLTILRDRWVYFTQSLLGQRDGQLLQISISDREFLHTISQLLRINYGNIEVSKFNLYQQQKQLLLTFLSEQGAPAEVVWKIEDSVLKTVRK